MSSGKHIRILLITLMALGSHPAWSSERYALVIGNNDYQEIGKLANPINDARAISEKLGQFGFKRLNIDGQETDQPLENLDRRGYLKAANNFIETVKSSDDVEMVFIYYAGHGMQRNDKPYLLPVDVPADNWDLISKEAVEMDSLLSDLDGFADLTIAVFDACREFQVDERTRSSIIDRDYRGLARLKSSGRSRLVAYAGAAGELVADSNGGKHSPYTTELLKSLEKPDRPVEDLLQDTAYRFGKKLGGQNPELLVQGVEPEKFYLVAPRQEPEDQNSNSADDASGDDISSHEQAAIVAELPVDLRDHAFWADAESFNSVGSYTHYLEKFPDGIYASIARDRLLALKAEQKKREAQRATELAKREEMQRQDAAKAEAERMARLAEQSRGQQEQDRLEQRREEVTRTVLERLERQRQEIEAQWPERGISTRLAEQPSAESGNFQRRDEIKARMQKGYELAIKNRQIIDPMIYLSRIGQDDQFDAEKLRELAEIAKQEEQQLDLTRNWRRGLQVALNSIDINVGPADGMLGARSRAGIAQWQLDNELIPTGYLNDEDYELLVAELAISPIEGSNTTQRKVFEPDMVLLPAGVFEMGEADAEADERPVRTVNVSTFEIGKYEITFDQYDMYARENNVPLPDDEGWGRGNRPVINVSRNDARGYISWLNSKTSGGYRLPSEAEWEYAARASSKTPWNFGNVTTTIARYGNVTGQEDNYKYTAPVGSFLPNAFGLYDTHGNILEWVSDCWHNNYAGAPATAVPWITGCASTGVVLRGGSWARSANSARSAFRLAYNPDLRMNQAGFRVARTVQN